MICKYALLDLMINDDDECMYLHTCHDHTTTGRAGAMFCYDESKIEMEVELQVMKVFTRFFHDFTPVIGLAELTMH